MTEVVPSLSKKIISEEPPGSTRFSQEVFHKLNRKCLGSDGRYLWQVFGVDTNTPKMVMGNGRPLGIDSSLENALFMHMNKRYLNLIEIMYNHWESSLSQLLDLLSKHALLIKRHTSQLFLFNNSTFVTYLEEKGYWARIEPGTSLFKELCTNPYISLQIHREWHPRAANFEKPLVDRTHDCPLTQYLRDENNSQIRIIMFYTWFGQLLHKPGQYEQWERSLAIDLDGKDSGLRQLVVRFFPTRDIIYTSNPQLKELDGNDRPSIPLIVCKFGKLAYVPPCQPLRLAPNIAGQKSNTATAIKKKQGRHQKAKAMNPHQNFKPGNMTPKNLALALGRRQSTAFSKPTFPSHIVYVGSQIDEFSLPKECIMVMDSDRNLAKIDAMATTNMCEILHLADEIYRHTISALGSSKKAFDGVINPNKVRRWLESWRAICKCCTKCEHK